MVSRGDEVQHVASKGATCAHLVHLPDGTSESPGEGSKIKIQRLNHAHVAHTVGSDRQAGDGTAVQGCGRGNEARAGGGDTQARLASTGSYPRDQAAVVSKPPTHTETLHSQRFSLVEESQNTPNQREGYQLPGDIVDLCPRT